MFKINNKNTRMTSRRRSGIFIVNIDYISHLFSTVSGVEFEQVNVSRVVSKIKLLSTTVVSSTTNLIMS